MERIDKVKAVAIAFMADDPGEYVGETLEDVMNQLKETDDAFLNHAYEWFVVGSKS